MSTDLKVVVKRGVDLTQQELDSINDAKFLEWRKLPMDEAHKDVRLFVLLKDQNGSILAQAQLHRIDGVIFNSEQFSVFDVGAVLSHIKGKGYGSVLIKGIIEYLNKQKIIGVGFTGEEVIQFFKKSGFEISCDLIKQFVLIKNGKKQLYSERSCIFYYDPEDILFSNILKMKDSEVILPRDPEW